MRGLMDEADGGWVAAVERRCEEEVPAFVCAWHIALTGMPQKLREMKRLIIP